MKDLLMNKKGMSALLTVVIIGVSTVIMSVSASLLSIGELEMGDGYNNGNKALYMADGCLENVLRQIQLDSSYVASDEIFQVNGGHCVINVVAVGDNRAIVTEGVLENYNKKISASILLSNNQVQLTNWEIIN